eukprot:3940147-Rhodomonas_salina.3
MLCFEFPIERTVSMPLCDASAAWSWSQRTSGLTDSTSAPPSRSEAALLRPSKSYCTCRTGSGPDSGPGSGGESEISTELPRPRLVVVAEAFIRAAR